MRRSIIYGDVQPDTDLMTSAEKEIFLRAGNAINEYRLISNGAASFASLGYCASDGIVPMVKAMEFLAIDSDIKEATEEKRKHGN